MRIRTIVGAVLTLALLLSFVGFAAEAATFIDTDTKGSLRLSYSYDGTPFEGLQIRIFRVAEVSAYGDFTLTGNFYDLPVDVNHVKTQDEWRELASTFSAYVTANEIAPEYELLTDGEGQATFADLPLGLYLVYMVRADQEDGYCHFDSFMISVPTLDAEDNWVYSVESRPKSVQKVIVPKEISYTVSKLWRDEGNANKRPQAVTIALYRDGEYVETVVLSEENNWMYTWTVVDDGAIWQAVELNVPEGYTVTLEQNGNCFLVTNSYEGDDDPPDTGDIGNPRLYLVAMCVAGVGLVTLGLTGKKKGKV